MRKDLKDEITFSRIDKDILCLVDLYKENKENRREFLRRLVEDYAQRGIQRRISILINNLQTISTYHIHEDFNDTLELFKAILIKAHKEGNKFKRAEVSKEVYNSLNNTIKKLDKEIYKKSDNDNDIDIG